MQDIEEEPAPAHAQSKNAGEVGSIIIEMPQPVERNV